VLQYLYETQETVGCREGYLYSKTDNIPTDIDDNYSLGCLCAKYDITEIMFVSEIKTVCESYMMLNLYYLLAVGFYGIIVTSFNQLFIVIIKQSMKMLKPKNLSKEAVSIMTTIFLAQFINTALPLMIVNMKVSGVDWVDYT
jgi:hypothetical protein